MTEHADKPLRLDKIEWHTGVPPHPTFLWLTDKDRERLGRAVDNLIEKQKEEDK